MMGKALGALVVVVWAIAWACGSEDTTSVSAVSSSVASSSASQGGGGASVASSSSVGGCEAQCESMYGTGRSTLEALENCIYCEACFTLCEPEGYCPRGGREAGCSAMFSECAECAYSMCSWDFPSNSGVCIDEYLACDGSACIDLWSCLDAC